MFEELYLEGRYQKRGVCLPGARVPVGVAVLIVGKGSPSPPAVPWWGGRGGGLAQGGGFGGEGLQGFDAIPRGRAVQTPGTRLQDTAPSRTGEAKQQKKLFP